MISYVYMYSILNKLFKVINRANLRENDSNVSEKSDFKENI